MQARTGLPAAVAIAQAALETGWGRQRIIDKWNGRDSHNLFGIKWNGQGDYVTIDAREYLDGRWVRHQERFKAYESYEDCFMDYANLLSNSKRYSRALEYKSDPVAFARAIHRAGYATDPQYSDKIVSIIKRYNLDALSDLVEPAEDEQVTGSAGNGFPDVSPDDPRAGVIMWAVARELLSPFPDGTFRPDNQVSRADLCMILHKLVYSFELTREQAGDPE